MKYIRKQLFLPWISALLVVSCLLLSNPVHAIGKRFRAEADFELLQTPFTVFDDELRIANDPYRGIRHYPIKPLGTVFEFKIRAFCNERFVDSAEIITDVISCHIP